MAYQLRNAPAYMMYAATLMATINYRIMSLAARGFMFTLLNELWVNLRLPADPEQLARVLGYQPAEVRSLLPEVMHFFRKDGEFLVSPELDSYRERLAERRERQSEGGKRGSKVVNHKRRSAGRRVSSSEQGNSSSNSQATSESTRESSIQPNTSQTNTTQSLGPNVLVRDPWAKEYDDEERKECTADDYRAARE